MCYASTTATELSSSSADHLDELTSAQFTARALAKHRVCRHTCTLHTSKDNIETSPGYCWLMLLCRYWHDKGLTTILIGRLLNLTALAFTIIFSGFLLLAVNWQALHDDCLLPHEPHKSCDLLAVGIHKHPWEAHSRGLVGLVGLYLGLCCMYWVWSAVQLVCEMRDVLDVKHFVNNKLGISDRQVSIDACDI